MTTRLASLLTALDNPEVVGGDPDVTSVTQDSRSVIEGSLYCCIPGSVVDGHDFAAGAVAAGAGSLLVERWLDVGAAQVRVASTREAVGPLAAEFWSRPSKHMDVVGVTGTNGKTTTTHLLGAILRANGTQTGIIGTLSGSRTTPEAPVLQEQLARLLAEGHRAVAMEVSSMALDQFRVDGVEFRVGVFTNLSQDHLDYHGDMESYFAAKRRLFEPGRCGLAAVNTDDAWGRRLLADLQIPSVPYSLADAGTVETWSGGARFSWRGSPVTLALAGAHNVSNALAAATVADALGVAPDIVARGLTDAPPVPGRWESIAAGQPFTVVVDYAHTPDGLAQVLGAARSAAAGGRVVVVFGCGGDRDHAKRPMMAATATRMADLAVLTSDNPRSEDPLKIIAEAAAGAAGPGELVIEADREAAIALALDRAQPGDVVVVAGKGHETGQTIGTQVLPFDDREVTRRLLEAGR